MAVEHINENDTLNAGRVKINAALDSIDATAQNAVNTANQAISTANNAVSIANDAKTQAQSTQTQLDNIIIENGQSDAEVVQARTKADGTSFPLLKDRLNDVDDKIGILNKKTENVVSITEFGASESIIDNAPAIQSAIDYVASRGGGTVLIPKGTFYVVAQDRTIILKSNVTIQGVSRDLSIIKIHDSTGDWGELFTHPIPNEVLRNITFKDLTMDCNINNPVTDSGTWGVYHHRTFINGGEGYNYLVDNVKFIANGVWVIKADANNTTLRNCEVEYNLSTYPAGWFDISAFWLGGEHNHIENNLFYCSDMTSFTPETAIEFQGHNCHVHDNICLGFTNGILPTPLTSYDNHLIQLEPGGRGIKIYNNTIEASNKGIFIWPMNLPEGYLENLRIYNNTIYINDLQQGHSEPNAGIDFKLQTPTWTMTTPMRNISIYNNYIEYKTRTVSEDLYTGDAGIKAYINVELTDLDIRDNTIVNCGGNGIAIHMDVNYNNWIKRVNILNNVFKNTKTPICVNRNVSDVLIKGNVFEQDTLYPNEMDNMKITIKTANKTYSSNKNYKIISNEVKCVDGVKPFYPIYDLLLIWDGSSYPSSRGMVVEKNTPESSMILEPPTELNAVITVAKGQYIRRLDGKLYKTKYNYPSTIGNLKGSDGTTPVTIVRWVSSTKLEVSDATNIKPNQALALDWQNYFQSAVFYVTSVTGNIIETNGAGTGATLKAGVTADQVVGSVLNYYTDLVEVV